MTETDELLEEAEERLDTAKFLMDNQKLAASVSEAYYAMYHSAKALLKTKGSEPKTHSGTASELGKLFRDEIERELISSFTDVRELREKADYDIHRDFTESDVEEVVSTAEDFLKEVKTYIGSK